MSIGIGEGTGNLAVESGSRNTPAQAELKVNLHEGARVFCGGLLIIPSLGGRFELFERDLTGRRKRLFLGPWRGSLVGSLSKRSVRDYFLNATDASTKFAYEINYRQSNPEKIEVSFSFKAPINRISHLSFEIFKLSGELFKGAKITAFPRKRGEPNNLPLKPRSMENRFLLSNKRRVLIQSSICDLEISDVNSGNTINIADFRRVPWDRKKSFYFYAKKNFLVPGKQYNFKYRIKFSDPTGSNFHVQSANKVGSFTAGYGKTFFSIQPKEELPLPGNYYFQSEETIFDESGDVAGSVLAKELKNDHDIDVLYRLSPPTLPGRGIFIRKGLNRSRDISALPREGFEIDISTDRIIVTGADERGCLYGVYALLSRISSRNGKKFIRCGKMRDWPDIRMRGMCLELLPPAIRDVNIFKRYIYALSKARCNLLIFYFNPRQILAWKKRNDDGGWTKDQIREVINYARSLNMTIWSGVLSKFNPRQFPNLAIVRGSNFYNPFEESSYSFLLSLYDEVLKVAKPSVFLIGHDEIKGLSSYASKYGKPAQDVLAEDIKRLDNALKAKGVQVVIWGDMLLNWKSWSSLVGAAHGGNPNFNSGPTYKAISRIPRDVFILDWHYFKRSEYPSLGYFRKNGFRVLGCTWFEPKAAYFMAKSVKKYRAQGVLGSDWGFWRTLSPSATTLYATLCGWSTDLVPDSENRDVMALAAILRGDTEKRWEKEIPLDLSDVYNETTYDSRPNDSRGLFDMGRLLDLRELPKGKKRFGGVLFNVPSSYKGTKNNCLVLSNYKYEGNLPREVSIHVGDIKVKGVALLHTCYVEEPRYRPRSLGKYIFRYEDGKTETVEVIEGWNITDTRSVEGLRYNDWSFSRCPDILIGSRLGWRGFSSYGIPMNLQVMIWKNPYPEKQLKRIELRANDIGEVMKIAVLAVTVLN